MNPENTDNAAHHASFLFCPSRKPGIGGVSVKICLSSGTGALSMLLPSSWSSTEDKRINMDKFIKKVRVKTWQGRHSDITQTYFSCDVLIDFYFPFERLPRVLLDMQSCQLWNCTPCDTEARPAPLQCRNRSPFAFRLWHTSLVLSAPELL